MEQLTFKEVADLVNRIGNTTIDLSPIEERATEWTLHKGSVQSGRISFDFQLLYFLSDAKAEGFRSALSRVRAFEGKDDLQVVFANSLEAKYPQQVRTLRAHPYRAMSLTEYFASFIRQQLDNYLGKVRALSHANYVDPQITVPSGFVRKIPNPVLGLLTETDGGYGVAGAIGILLAEPGQGKTFMSKYLASVVASRNLVPIYVHSEQWSKMQPDDLSSIWKTVFHSFRFFESPIGWAEGAEEDFLRVALKAGLFRIIFDGFDEYVLRNQGKVDALETIQVLAKLADRTDARILITSRTSFWESEIEEKTKESTSVPALIYTIEPFDQNHARTYFQKRFPAAPASVELSAQLFLHLRQRTASTTYSFVGRGFFLYLIADLVERGASIKDPTLASLSTIRWVMEKLCEREQLRQALDISAAQQLTVLREFATLCIAGEKPTSETLRLVISATTVLEDAAVEALVGDIHKPGQLHDHPLLEQVGPDGEWVFVQEQVRFALLAEKLLELATSFREAEQLRGFIASGGFSTQLQIEVVSALLDQLEETLGRSEMESTVAEVITAIQTCSRYQLAASASSNPAAMAALIAVSFVNRLFPKGASRKDKAIALQALLPRRRLENLCFFGTLSRFDFSGITFFGCHFDNVTWASCKFDSETGFEACRFSGGSVLSCEQFGLCRVDGKTIMDAEARSVRVAAEIRDGQRAYGIDELRRDISDLVRKFHPSEGAGVRSLKESSLYKGPISESVHRDEVIEAFKRFLLETHNIRSDAEGVHLTAAAKDAVMHFVSNGVMAGPLAEAYQFLRNKLGLRD